MSLICLTKCDGCGIVIEGWNDPPEDWALIRLGTDVQETSTRTKGRLETHLCPACVKTDFDRLVSFNLEKMCK